MLLSKVNKDVHYLFIVVLLPKINKTRTLVASIVIIASAIAKED